MFCCRVQLALDEFEACEKTRTFVRLLAKHRTDINARNFADETPVHADLSHI